MRQRASEVHSVAHPTGPEGTGAGLRVKHVTITLPKMSEKVFFKNVGLECAIVIGGGMRGVALPKF